MINISNLTYRISGRLLLDSVSVAIPSGHRIGLVGKNGTGKSTLLKLIAKDLQPDEGNISISGLRNLQTDIGIIENDLVGVKKASTAENGSVVVARLEDEVTLKRFVQELSLIHI